MNKRMMSVMAVSVGLLLATAGMAAEPAGAKGRALEDGFVTPPDSAKPRTWWHWLGGHISREGITADLESMKRVGLGGARFSTWVAHRTKARSSSIARSGMRC